MKMLIDIPESEYKRILKEKDSQYSQCHYWERLIINGIPLKGHGRLVDIDWIEDNCPDYRTDDDGSWCYKWVDIKKTPTIIPADEEDEDADSN